MRYNKLLSVLTFFLAGSFYVHAQNEVSEIRSYYNTIGKQIIQCKTDKENCQLYSNLNITNTGNLSWRASGTYKKEVQFWYNDSPRNCEECGKEGINVLKKVMSSEIAGLYTTYKEWLYKDGKLIFYYIKTTGEKTEEYRYYYQDDSLIKHLETGNTIKSDDKSIKIYSEMILQKAKILQQQFLLNFK